MRTKEWLRAELRNRLPLNEPLPPLTAVETLLCEAIDRLSGIPIKNPLKPHEDAAFEERIGRPL